MVARALLLRPRVILADEPVSMVDASLRATILGALRQMTLDLQIPVIYITHDLATAYQIAENIVVLYRGAVVEAGDVELVVKDPRHPYTQLLIGSIPLPGVDADVGGRRRAGPGEPAPGGGRSGLSLRGPLSVGHAGLPGLGAAAVPDRASPRRSSCFLYQDAPAVPAREMSDGVRRGRGPARRPRVRGTGPPPRRRAPRCPARERSWSRARPGGSAGPCRAGAPRARPPGAGLRSRRASPGLRRRSRATSRGRPTSRARWPGSRRWSTWPPRPTRPTS